jgi:hypothetical protein
VRDAVLGARCSVLGTQYSVLSTQYSVLGSPVFFRSQNSILLLRYAPTSVKEFRAGEVAEAAAQLAFVASGG